MTYVLIGITDPVEHKRREVPKDPEEARALLRELVPGRSESWYIDQDDDQVAERVAESRITQEVPSTNGQSILELSIPEGLAPMDAVNRALTAVNAHTSNPVVWVECPNATIKTLLIASLAVDGKEPLTYCPKDWMADEKGNPPPRAWEGLAMLASFTMLALMFMATRLNLRTNAGRDFQSRVMGDGTQVGAGTGTMRPADYLAITENATAPALADTSLTGELTGGGLGRAQALYAHVAASTTYTLVYEWTSSDGTPRTINKMAVFNASSAGTMVFESLVPSPPTLVSGDKLEITSTVDIS